MIGVICVVNPLRDDESTHTLIKTGRVDDNISNDLGSKLIGLGLLLPVILCDGANSECTSSTDKSSGARMATQADVWRPSRLVASHW